MTASTTNMPLPVVTAPFPAARVMRRKVFPVAPPPSITSLSEGESSWPR
ncbi:MAG: hypothetical protein WDN45_01310 [Caulobacteraceae bacterium]